MKKLQESLTRNKTVAEICDLLVELMELVREQQLIIEQLSEVENERFDNESDGRGSVKTEHH